MSHFSNLQRLAAVQAGNPYDYQYASYNHFKFPSVAPLRSFKQLAAQPAQPTQEQTPDIWQELFKVGLELGWRALDAPSHNAFRLGGLMTSSPYGLVRLSGGLLCYLAFMRGLEKLDEKINS